MVKETLLKSIKKDFKTIFEEKNILGILLYGSYSIDQETNRSDVDICIVAPKENNFELFSYISQTIDIYSKKYDVRFFSELPIHIKIKVIENGILIYSPDKYELYEYFYFYRKLWNDQKHRQKVSKEELLSF